MDQGWNEYQELYRQYADLADGVGIHYAIGFRVVRDFYEVHKDRILELLKYCEPPAFVEILSDMKHYWAVKHEFQAIDSVGGNVQLSTAQLDVKDAELYGIRYIDSDGSSKGCIICHSSIGSIERWIYSIFEVALKKERPTLPLWLSPAQLRLVPVTEEYFEYCDSLKFDNIRVEIDNRNERIGKKFQKLIKTGFPMS